MNQRKRIAYIEDHKIVKEGVTFLLSQYPDIELIKDEFPVEKIVEFVNDQRLDLVIMDLQLKESSESKKINGFEICEIMTSNFLQLKIIAHSMYDDVENVNKFFKCGGIAFVSKKSGHLELLKAIRSASEGKKFLCKEITGKTKNSNSFIDGEDDLLKAKNNLFTKTEMLVLQKIAKGFSTKQIAQQLGVSEKTIETHRKHLFEKASVKNVAELIAFSFSRNLFLE